MAKRNTLINWKKANGIDDLVNKSVDDSPHEEKHINTGTGFKYVNPTQQIANEVTEMRRLKKATAIIRKDFKKELQFKYPTHCNEFIDANIFRLTSEKIKEEENLEKDKLRKQKEMNRTMIPLRDGETHTSGKRDSIKDVTIRKTHYKSNSFNPNLFLKYEYYHPGKFIKFDYESHDAWSCCLNDDKNNKVKFNFFIF